MEIVIGWVALNRYCAVQVPFYSPEFELFDTFCKQQFNPKIKERQILHKSWCGVSVAREQQYNQDLKRIYKRDYEF